MSLAVWEAGEGGTVDGIENEDIFVEVDSVFVGGEIEIGVLGIDISGELVEKDHIGRRQGLDEWP